MNHSFLTVALGCGQCKNALEATVQSPFVVFGTMHGATFANLTAECVSEVYFYETG